MKLTSDLGRRLLPAAIDQLAESEPSRPWASVPRDNEDLTQGYVDITYGQFANAINHAAAWLHSTLGPSAEEFETIAYEGPNDIRLPAIAVAAAKVGRKILLPFPLLPASVKSHLLDVTKVKVFIYAQSSQASAESILRERAHLQSRVAPSLQEWMTEESAKLYEYRKSWDEAKDDPWLIFHTSGTTGLPKPVTYTNLMMTSVDVAQLLPGTKERTQFGSHINRRVFSTIPMNHLVGMTAILQGTVWLGTIIVLGPPGKPPLARIASQVLQYSGAVGFAAPPFLIREFCQQPDMLQRLRTMEFVQWAGAPLDEATGNALCQHVTLCPAFGTTECGPYVTNICDDLVDWPYLWFRDGQGIELQPRTDSLFELVFRKQSGAFWQQIFILYPELEVYATKDLFQKHPSKDYLWLYSGRLDDMVILSNGQNVPVSNMEEVIMRHPAIQQALVGGEGRNRPFLILQLADNKYVQAEDPNTLLSSVWPAVEAANESCPEFAKLSKELTIFSSPKKPFLQAAKESLRRRETLALYEPEIDALYMKTDTSDLQAGDYVKG